MSKQTDKPDLLFEVNEYLSPHLSERGFAVSVEAYDPDAFGNCVIKLQSNDFIVLVTRDKGQVFMDIGLSTHPEQLFSLGVLVAYLDGAQDVLPLESFDEECALLLQYEDRLFDKRLLADQSEDIVGFRKEWSDRRWERLLGKPSAEE